MSCSCCLLIIFLNLLWYWVSFSTASGLIPDLRHCSKRHLLHFFLFSGVIEQFPLPSPRHLSSCLSFCWIMRLKKALQLKQVKAP